VPQGYQNGAPTISNSQMFHKNHPCFIREAIKIMKHTRKLTRKILPTLPSGAEVKIMWICTSTPPYILMVWCLVKHRIHLHDVVLKHRDNFTSLCIHIEQNLGSLLFFCLPSKFTDFSKQCNSNLKGCLMVWLYLMYNLLKWRFSAWYFLK
jgi:hypothetical protein